MGLRADLRAAVPDATAALIATVLIFVWLYVRVRSGTSPTVEVFVPGGYPSGTGVVAILIGLLALYIAIPLGLLFYFRGRTGARLWRALHRFIIVVYVLSVWHTLLYGMKRLVRRLAEDHAVGAAGAYRRAVAGQPGTPGTPG